MKISELRKPSYRASHSGICRVRIFRIHIMEALKMRNHVPYIALLWTFQRDGEISIDSLPQHACDTNKRYHETTEKLKKSWRCKNKDCSSFGNSSSGNICIANIFSGSAKKFYKSTWSKLPEKITIQMFSITICSVNNENEARTRCCRWNGFCFFMKVTKDSKSNLQNISSNNNDLKWPTENCYAYLWLSRQKLNLSELFVDILDSERINATRSFFFHFTLSHSNSINPPSLYWNFDMSIKEPHNVLSSKVIKFAKKPLNQPAVLDTMIRTCFIKIHCLLTDTSILLDVLQNRMVHQETLIKDLQ